MDPVMKWIVVILVLIGFALVARLRPSAAKPSNDEANVDGS